MKTIWWLLVAGGVILFGVVIFGLYKSSTTPKNLSQFTAPTKDQPFLSGPQVRYKQIDDPLPSFGPPDPQHPWLSGPQLPSIPEHPTVTPKTKQP